MERRTFLAASVAAGAALATQGARASDRYPTRPVTIVLPFPPGNQVDALLRIMAQQWPREFGDSAVVENRPGATGAIGTSYVARTKPDGYTLLMAANSSHVLGPLLLKTRVFDPVDDFSPIIKVGEYGFVLIVRNDFPAKSLQEFIAVVRASPGKFNFASLGEGSGAHLMAESFKAATGLDIVHVPYKTYPTVAVVGKEIDIFFDGVGTAKPFVDSGKVRAIAVTGQRRSALYPDLPCTAELGVPMLDLKIWAGLLAPRGTPAAIVENLNQKIARIVRTDPATQAYVRDNGFEVVLNSAEQFGQQIRGEIAYWKQFVDRIGLKPQ
jgi:tripartite-type tricarboxylate transporter receptor subunit TctC